MRIGVDFGTSYSAAGAVIDGTLQLVRFGSADQFRTTVYFPRQLPDVGRFELSPALEEQVAGMIRSSQGFEREQIARARAAHTQAMREPAERRAEALALVPTVVPRTPQQHRDAAIAAVRRQWLAEQAREALEGGVDVQTALYGDDAVDAYLANEGAGHLVVSPKSMLGYSLVGNARETLTAIATHILRHVRTTASAQFGTEVRSAVLGRPVMFRSSLGEAGSAQAVQLLTEAAIAAGLESVEFLEEPAAAAIGHHRELDAIRRVLVVDIGGGTSDLALATIGGHRPAPDILRSWGEPIGGTDVDIELSMLSLMPLFGKGITAMPVHHYFEASAVQDMQRQANFHRASFAGLDAPYAQRMRRLQQAGHAIRLNRAVERAKIRLSTDDSVTLRLDYIEEGLRGPVSRAQLDAAASRFLSMLRSLLKQARSDMGEAPDAIYLTGGMSRSPHIKALARQVFPDADVVAGNASLGVVSGLAHTASIRHAHGVVA